MYVTSCTVLCLNSLYHNHIFNRPSKCMLNKKKSNVYSYYWGQYWYKLWENLNIHIVPLLTAVKDDYYLKLFKRIVQVIIESRAWDSILVEKKRYQIRDVLKGNK